MPYTPHTWTDNSGEEINADNLNEIETGIDDAHTLIDDHLADTSDAHDASAISVVPFATIAATDVQAALQEVYSEAGGGGSTTELLGVAQYDPGTGGSYTTTSTSLVDVDATNLAVTFTAPASGKVLVRLTGYCQISSTAGAASWGVRESTTDLISGAATRESNALCVSRAFLITGISGGSHTYKWAHRATSGHTASLHYGGAIPSGSGPLTMEVWSVP